MKNREDKNRIITNSHTWIQKGWCISAWQRPAEWLTLLSKVTFWYTSVIRGREGDSNNNQFYWSCTSLVPLGWEKEPIWRLERPEEKVIELLLAVARGSICSCFLANRQESTIADFWACFDALFGPFYHFSKEVMEEMFLKGWRMKFVLKYYASNPYA